MIIIILTQGLFCLTLSKNCMNLLWLFFTKSLIPSLSSKLQSVIASKVSKKLSSTSLSSISSTFFSSLVSISTSRADLCSFYYSTMSFVYSKVNSSPSSTPLIAYRSALRFWKSSLTQNRYSDIVGIGDLSVLTSERVT